MSEPTVDLREVPEALVQTSAFYAVRELKRGESLRLLTRDEPSLMMQSLDLQLRHNLAWEVSRTSAGHFEVLVRPRADTAAADVIDLLTREHKRLDGLFGRAIHLVDAGDMAQAQVTLGEFVAGLKRHLRAENDVIAPLMQAPRSPLGDDPTSIMLREHADILAQAEMIATSFAAAPVASYEVAPLMAILAGVLAKHEYREEANLFPHWRAALHQAPPEAQRALLARVQAVLGSENA